MSRERLNLKDNLKGGNPPRKSGRCSMSECRTETGRKAGGNMSFDEAVDELKRILDGLRAAVLTDLTAAPSKI